MSNNLNSTSQFRPRLDGLWKMGLVAFGIGALLFAGTFLGLLGGAVPPEIFWGRFFQSYLIGYLFWVGVTMGSSALLLLHNTVAGGWGFLLKRQLTAATANLPLMALLTLPLIIWGFDYLYPWANEAMIRESRILQFQQRMWMEPWKVILRLVIYFAVMMTLVHFVNKWTWGMNKQNAEKNVHALNLLGPPGLFLYVTLMTFMAVDLLMSITAQWFSSIIGLLFVVMQGLSTWCLMSVLTAYVAAHKEPLVHVPRRYIRDIGNFTLAFTLLWAYMSYSQLVITFSGNMAEEAVFYQVRQQGGWQIVGLLLLAAHFALPFLALLSSAVKTDISNLAKLSLIIIFMRFVDLYYWVVPGTDRAFSDHVNFARLPLDVSMPLAIGGLWIAMWAWQMRDKPLIPEDNPRLYGAWPLGTHHEPEPIGYEDVEEDALSEAEVTHQHG